MKPVRTIGPIQIDVGTIIRISTGSPPPSVLRFPLGSGCIAGEKFFIKKIKKSSAWRALHIHYSSFRIQKQRESNKSDNPDPKHY
jgi:hypothetical protein